MEHPRISATAGVLAALILTSCSTDEEPQELTAEVDYQPVALSEATAIDDAVAASLATATEILSQDSEPGENTVISPASLSLALAMLAEGAEGPADEALSDFLGASDQDRREAFSALQAALGEYAGDPSVVEEDELPEVPVLHLANQLVMQEGEEPDQEVLNNLGQYFDAGIVETDFASEESKELLDSWVSENTGGLIEESAIEAPDPEMLFTLQNAVLFAAEWRAPFDPERTDDLPFTTDSGEEVEAEMMRHDYGSVRYTEYDDAQIIRLPYSEGFAMDVVLPAEGHSPEEFTAEDWTAVDEAFAEEPTAEVELTLPKVEARTDTALDGVLQDQGLGPIYSGDDLSPLGPVWVGTVNQQAVLAIDEEGTVAAAVTEIGMVSSAPGEEETEPVEMTVDRPYTLRIVHDETNLPLFMAVINDPTRE